MSQPFRGIDSLYLFPYYQTPAAYQAATGQEAPPFDADKPPKHWADTAPEAPDAGKRAVGRVVMYDRALAMDKSGYHAASGEDGKPFFEPLVLDKTAAATVNIPVPGSIETLPQIQPPLRALTPFEELVFQFGGTPAVRDTSVPLPGTGGDGFSQKDRDLLLAIAKVLGI